MKANQPRRKNTTRETTGLLKAWLNEHRKNPYPNKSEKIMLAVITKMSLTQVSTWFANARRRLKKENKATWSMALEQSFPELDEPFSTAPSSDCFPETAFSQPVRLPSSPHMQSITQSQQQSSEKANSEKEEEPSPVKPSGRIWSLVEMTEEN